MQNATNPCRSQDLVPFLSVMYFSCHPSPPTILPSSFTSSCLLFLGLPLNLVVPKFIYISLLGILFSSILSTCPNQPNLFNLIVSVIVGFLHFHNWLIPSNFLFHCQILGLIFFYVLSFQECSIAFYLCWCPSFRCTCNYAITKSFIYSNPKFIPHTAPRKDLEWMDMKFWGSWEKRRHRNF